MESYYLRKRGKKNVDRLPIVVSYNGCDQLLGAPALDTG